MIARNIGERICCCKRCRCGSYRCCRHERCHKRLLHKKYPFSAKIPLSVLCFFTTGASEAVIPARPSASRSCIGWQYSAVSETFPSSLFLVLQPHTPRRCIVIGMVLLNVFVELRHHACFDVIVVILPVLGRIGHRRIVGNVRAAKEVLTMKNILQGFFIMSYITMKLVVRPLPAWQWKCIQLLEGAFFTKSMNASIVSGFAHV